MIGGSAVIGRDAWIGINASVADGRRRDRALVGMTASVQGIWRMPRWRGPVPPTFNRGHPTTSRRLDSCRVRNVNVETREPRAAS